MKKKGLALFMAVFVTAGTVFAPAETGLIYAAQATEEQTETSSASDMPTGLMPVEAVGEIVLDEGTAQEEEVENVIKSAAVYSSDWEKYGSYYFYNQLDKKEKAYWDALNKVCLKYITTQADAVNYQGTNYYYIDGVFSSSLSLAQIEEVYRIFRYSNPQYYFLKSAYIRTTYNGEHGIAACVYPAFVKGSSRAKATKKVQSKVSSWQKKIDACSTDAAKVKKIHDLIIDKVEYNQALVNSDYANEDNEYSQSAYSVFCTDLTVCAGYSQAFEMMCNGSGIDAVAVTSAAHEWNKVRINDSWYNVDCTWDDADGRIYYDYFERSDEYFDTVSSQSYAYHMEEDIWDGYLPACTLDSGATSTSAGKVRTSTKTTAKPVISASASGSSYKVKITCSTSGAAIYYTTDGSTPNQAYSKGTRYTGAFTVASGKTVKAVAVCNKYEDSSVASKKMEKEAASYKITFNANGGRGSMSKQSMAKGVSTAISKNKFSKKYYTFTGWNTKVDGKGKSYKNKEKIKLTKNITLYAQWKPAKYKITYKLNGGKNAKNPASYTCTTSTIKLKNPTRKGYVFKGWYLDKKFKKKVTVINKGSSGNKTLYAKWKKK